MYTFLLRTTDIITSQNTGLSSWDSLYKSITRALIDLHSTHNRLAEAVCIIKRIKHHRQTHSLNKILVHTKLKSLSGKDQEKLFILWGFDGEGLT
jgi:hypothetical protein